MRGPACVIAGACRPWKWDNDDPFGNNVPNEDADNNGQSFEFNLRFPGQYFDKETGLHYNYFRDYDPSTGRYIQSDPIGLAGGINTYGYADQAPTLAYDPFGLYCAFIGMNSPVCKATNVTRRKITAHTTDYEWFPAPDPSATPDMSRRRPAVPWPGMMIKWREIFGQIGFVERQFQCSVWGVLRCWDDCTGQLISETYGSQDAGARWEKEAGSDFNEITSYGQWKEVRGQMNPDDLPIPRRR